MSETQEHYEGSQVIIDVIRRNKVEMRPRWHFVLRAALAIALAVLLVLALLYIVSFIIFALHENGVWFAAEFGLSGWSLALSALPWGLLLLAFVLLLLLANLLRRYTFIYQHPLFYFLFGFIVVVALSSFLIAATSFHPEFFHYAETGIPFVGGAYQNFYRFETASPSSIHRGEIIAFSDEGFVMEDDLGVTSTVVSAPGVVFIDNFHQGDVVLVFGPRRIDGTIQAFGIQRIAAATSTVPAPSSSAQLQGAAQ